MCLTCLRKNGIRAGKPFLTLIYEKRGFFRFSRW